MPAFAMTLEGQVVTVEMARRLAFDGIERNIDISVFEEHLKDPDYKENKTVLNGKASVTNRNVQLFRGFKVPVYAVMYYNNPKFTYYYVKNINQLMFVDIDEIDVKNDKTTFPYRIFRYDFKGKLIAVGIVISAEERFVYKSNGELISHWEGGICYNKKDKRVGSVEEVGW